MNINEFKELSAARTTETLESLGRLDCFSVEFDEVFSDEKDHKEHISGSVEISFEYKNCKRKHIINYGWDDAAGFGLEDAEGEIVFVTRAGIFMIMYFDLALSDLADEFLT